MNKAPTRGETTTAQLSTTARKNFINLNDMTLHATKNYFTRNFQKCTMSRNSNSPRMDSCHAIVTCHSMSVCCDALVTYHHTRTLARTQAVVNCYRRPTAVCHPHEQFGCFSSSSSPKRPSPDHRCQKKTKKNRKGQEAMIRTISMKQIDCFIIMY